MSLQLLLTKLAYRPWHKKLSYTIKVFEGDVGETFLKKFPPASLKMKEKSGFFLAVHDLVASIPVGKVMTYGQIARVLEGGYSPKLVGFAMHGAPEGLPCHRVVNRLGQMAGRGLFGGEEAQRDLLKREGVPFLPDGRIDLERATYEPEFFQ